MMSAIEGDNEGVRTDVKGLLLKALDGLGSALLPLAALIFARADDMSDVFWVSVLAGGAAVLISVFIAYLSWTRLRYFVGESDIRVESGLLSRQARSVPFERIQDVAVSQGLFARLLRLVELTFETGAGGGEDISLSYLTEDEGERLRLLVRERRDTFRADSATDDDAKSELLFAMGPKRVLTLGLFRFSLVVFALVGGFFAQYDELLPFDPWDIEGWQHRLTNSGIVLAGLDELWRVIGIAVLVLFLGVFGVGTGIVRTVLTEWNFRLERSDQGFRRRRGLLTRTDVVLPVRRVQAVQINTGMVRNRFGWHGLSLVSLAADAGASNHDAAPLARYKEIEPLAEEAGVSLPEPDIAWVRVKPIFALYHGLSRMIWWTIPALIIWAVQNYVPMDRVIGDWRWGLVPLLVGAWKALRLGLSLLRTRCGLDDKHIYFAGGWLSPYLTICHREKLQSVAISSEPLARRHGYMALTLGVAGASVSIDGISRSNAYALRDSLLESMHHRDFGALN